MTQDAERMIEACDEALFSILTAFQPGDRRSFLGLLNLVRDRQPGYAYLEVGSDLGASLQPALSDPRCAVAYSVDLRVAAQPDERGRHYPFPDNTTAAMVANLRPRVGEAGIAKLRTFDCDLADVPALAIDRPPHLALVDAEHTNRAAFRDGLGVLRHLAPNAVLMFHDANLVFDGLLNFDAMLRDRGGAVWSAFLPDTLFAVALGDLAGPAEAAFAGRAHDPAEFLSRSRINLYREIVAHREHWDVS